MDQHNANLPTATLWGSHQAFTVQANGQLNNAGEYRPLIVAFRNGSPVRLQDLGRVIDSVQNDKSLNLYNLRSSIMLEVKRQPGTNTVEIVDNILKLMPSFRAQLPPSINLDVLADRSQAIRESVHDVSSRWCWQSCWCVLVIFLFLRNVSATLIPAWPCPCLSWDLRGMSLFGYTMDNLSRWPSRWRWASWWTTPSWYSKTSCGTWKWANRALRRRFEGGREIGFTVLSMTLSLAAVFIPVLFMKGIVGRLFHEFAVVIMSAIIISGIVSLSLTPMLCSRFCGLPASGIIPVPCHGAGFRRLAGHL